jgi:hypothetical protein
LLLQSTAVGEIVDSPHPHRSNSAETAAKLLRATLLTKPFPGTTAQGVVLVIAKEFSGL